MEVLNDVSFDVKTGETVVLCGQSGCGKTTLLNIISGIEIPTSGKVNLNTEKIAYVFQDDRLIPWKNVIQNVLFVMKTPDISRARRTIEVVGLGKFEKTKPAKLSGGMKKRLNLARALASEPELILMDEPFSSVDLKTKFSLIEFFKELLKHEIKSALIVTHDPEEAAILGDRIIIIGGNPSTVRKTVTPDVDKFNRKVDYIQNLTIKIKHLLQAL